MTNDKEATCEARVRRALERQGYILRKSRLRGPTHIHNEGGSQIVETGFGYGTNTSVDRESFTVSLADVEHFANR